ncbi:MAG: outer membrane protein [Alphaproteobacteria bacterium]|jgi:Skp family chaperone for outer membrane proteins|nr:outer membrane protein [Alphaproteobacteria bacterium]
MSLTPYLRATAALAALSFALFLDGSDYAQAAPAPAAPSVVVAPPPGAPAPAAAAPAAAAAAAGPSSAAPRIIVIDRQFILARSSAGQEMMAQAQNLSKLAETEFKAQEQQLVTEAGQLQQQLAIMAPDVRDQKEKEFTTKQQAFQGRVAQRQAEIQAGLGKAGHVIEVALEPILKSLMVERGANMVFDRGSVILSTVDVDVTPVAVQRLDKALPHVKVELTAVPGAAPPPVAAAARPPAAPAAGAPPAVRK